MMSSRNSSEQIICLRPESDFIEFDAIAPARFQVEYINPSDPAIMRFAESAKALIIPAVGSKIPNEIFENSNIKMVQVTGAGIDRIDADFCRKNQPCQGEPKLFFGKFGAPRKKSSLNKKQGFLVFLQLSG